MQIRVLKDIVAATSPLGLTTKQYKAGESYEIFDELAEVFLVQGWGESEQKMFAPKLENKAVQSAPENKSIEVISEEIVVEEPKKKGRPKK